MSVVRAAGLLIYRLFNNEIQYLMLRTSYGEHHWTPPKGKDSCVFSRKHRFFQGHVDPGESMREAAVRETMEEAGLKAEDYEIDENFEWKLNYQVRQLIGSCGKTLVFLGQRQSKGGRLLVGAIKGC